MNDDNLSEFYILLSIVSYLFSCVRVLIKLLTWTLCMVLQSRYTVAIVVLFCACTVERSGTCAWGEPHKYSYDFHAQAHFGCTGARRSDIMGIHDEWDSGLCGEGARLLNWFVR